MDSMLLDHLSYAAGPEGARTAAAELGRLLGAEFADGGFHPRFGTRNFTLALSAGRYVEVVEVLDHPAADKAVFGQVVRARSAEGGGWLGWVVAVEDMAEVEMRIGRQAIEGHRHLPDGTRLEWLQLGVRGLQCDPQLPFFVQWLSDPAVHPSVGWWPDRPARRGDRRVAVAGGRLARGVGREGAGRHPDRVGGSSRTAGSDRRHVRNAERGCADLSPSVRRLPDPERSHCADCAP